MSEFNVNVESGTSVRLQTAGKYCDRDIVVTAEGGSEDLDSVLTEQETLIQTLKETLERKIAESEPNIQPLTITENGEYTAPEGVDGYSPITVDVQSSGGGDGTTADMIAEGGYAEVNLPNATKIKGHAFYKDTLLNTLIAPKVTEVGDTAFRDCTNLSSLEIGVLTNVAQSAFHACKQITSISLSDDITRLGAYCFYDCEKLQLTKFPSSWSGSTGMYTFYGCKSITATELPSGLTNIYDYSFSNCSELALTSLPSGVTNIGSSAFVGCTSLALTELPSEIKSIGSQAFAKCTGITNLTFKGKPTSIYTSAFSGCTNLTKINVPWAEGAVANAPWGATNATINYNYVG